jgi:hypothetical protein
MHSGTSVTVPKGESFGIPAATGRARALCSSAWRASTGSTGPDLRPRCLLATFIELGLAGLQLRDSRRRQRQCRRDHPRPQPARYPQPLLERDRVRGARGVRRPEAQELLVGMQLQLAFSTMIPVHGDVLLVDAILAFGAAHVRRVYERLCLWLTPAVASAGRPAVAGRGSARP